MKKIAMILTVFLLCGISTVAFAKTAGSSGSGVEMDGSFGFGTGPGSFDPGFGLNFGAGMMFPNTDLQARIDVSYFDFSYRYGGVTDYSYTRIPITLSARYYMPISDVFKAFVQAGFEASVDKKDEPTYIGVLSHEVSELNPGLSVGGGVEYFMVPQASVFVLGRAHVVSDSYFSMHFGAAFHF